MALCVGVENIWRRPSKALTDASPTCSVERSSTRYDPQLSLKEETINSVGQPSRRVEKPWGFELIWAETHRYVGKILSFRPGHRPSLQRHEMKDEVYPLHEIGTLRRNPLRVTHVLAVSAEEPGRTLPGPPCRDIAEMIPGSWIPPPPLPLFRLGLERRQHILRRHGSLA
jgi:hypothetical protein